MYSTKVSAQRCVVPVKRAKQAADKQLHLRQAEHKKIRANPRSSASHSCIRILSLLIMPEQGNWYIIINTGAGVSPSPQRLSLIFKVSIAQTLNCQGLRKIGQKSRNSSVGKNQPRSSVDAGYGKRISPPVGSTRYTSSWRTPPIPGIARMVCPMVIVIPS
jgi:hypothetical protein